MILNHGGIFQIHNKHLYYHTPESGFASIGPTKMVVSLKETEDILKDTGLLDRNEMISLDKQIKGHEYLKQ